MLKKNKILIIYLLTIYNIYLQCIFILIIKYIFKYEKNIPFNKSYNYNQFTFNIIIFCLNKYFFHDKS